jgi:nucleoside-diphosphate-sugar epimerase
MQIGLVGASGFVGRAISQRFEQLAKFECQPILRGDDFESKIREVDFVIYSANSAKRFFANSNPKIDREETLDKTIRFLNASNDKPFLLISSISCRTQLDTAYGMNRKDCENAVLDYGGSVVRLGPMFGATRLHDVVHDICENRKVFVSKDSKQSFSSIDWNGAFIADNFTSWSGIVEIGARNTILLDDLAAYVSSSSEFEGEKDDQFPLNFDVGPDVLEVLEFVDQIMDQQKKN